ncbi:MAG: hypothetical protein ACLTVV_00990 [Ruminococcus sp.]
MENGQGEERTIYDDSLLRIFIRSGMLVFGFVVFACIVVAGLFIYRGDSVSETIKFTLFLLGGGIVLSYGSPLISLWKVWKQERVLGVQWKERTDQKRPARERDWYLTYDRGGFILIHRAYMKGIKGSRVEIEDTGSYNKGKVYRLIFEDINGESHSLKFSSDSEEEEFRRWYGKVQQ